VHRRHREVRLTHLGCQPVTSIWCYRR
jgi:hypothetical protein